MSDERREAEIDTLLRSLPPIEPPAKTIAATEAAIARRRAGAGRWTMGRWATLAAVAAVAVLAVAVPTAQRRSEAPVVTDLPAGGENQRGEDEGRYWLGPVGAAAGFDQKNGDEEQAEPATRFEYERKDDGPAKEPPPEVTTIAGNDNGRDRLTDDLELGQKLQTTKLDQTTDGKVTARLPTQGYFANTYLPGDPELAQLRASLASGLYRDGEKVPLEELAVAVVQPFDAPTERAVAVTVAADRDAVEGRTRLTLQVGLAGAEVRPTRRAPIAMALVVDLASIGDDSERRSLWGIAEAFIAARQPGDRFSLVVATASGPEVASGGTLREGLGFLAAAYDRRGGSLAAALEAAYGQARTDDEVAAAVVVLATARAPDARLATRAHEQALAGTELSVIAVGARASVEATAALAHAGEGRRWGVASPDDAARAIDDEIAASGRMVARALRLSLVLGRGVELHGVLGSHPLGAGEADAVRESEVAIDRRVQETTGIASDRGDDEAGIQIVIPAFMAGDRHVILLDVTVPGPGPVLEVRARWKDLVRMDNGAAETALTLARGDRDVSPAADNVRANRAAYETAKVLRAAAAALGRGQIEEARAAIAQAARDARAEDRRLLSAYLEVLATPDATSNGSLAVHVARSLELAAASRLGAR